MFVVLLIAVALYGLVLAFAPDELRPQGFLGFCAAWAGLLIRSDESERRVTWTAVSVVSLLVGLFTTNLIPWIVLGIVWIYAKRPTGEAGPRSDESSDPYAFLDD